MLVVAERSLEHAQQVHTLLTTHSHSLKAVALSMTLEHFMPLLQRVIDQARRRVLEGQSVPASDKLVSVFETHTAIIRRGKAPPHDTEFGRKVWYTEVDGGIVSEYRILPGNPPDNQDPWATSLKHHRRLFGHPPTTATADRGVYSSENEAMAQQAKVQEAALPQPGAKTPERRAHTCGAVLP